MRSGASRCGLALLGLALVLSGCTSATKRHYLKHLSTTIAPVAPQPGPMAVASESESAMAAANRDDHAR